MGKVIYTGAFRFPNGDAASQRVLGIGKSLRSVGYDVIYCGWEQQPRKEDLTNGKYYYEGFEYYSQAELDIVNKNIFQKTYNFVFKGLRTINWIKHYIKKEKIDYIISYNANSLFLLILFLLCKRNNIKMIGDCTEWYGANHLPGGKFGIPNLDNNLRIKTIYPLIKNVIVISSFLKTYLDKKRCHTIIIPPLVDLKEEKWINSNIMDSTLSKPVIKLIYAGDPGNKDLLQNIFDVLEIVNKHGTKFIFNVLGVKKEYFINKYFKSELDIPSYINCYGRVPLNEVPKYYKQNNFSILIRENKRYANAGFPTKLVESLSAGIPIIVNDTSDITNYIKNNINGFVVSNGKIQSILDCLSKIELIEQDVFNRMKIEAINTAINNFDYTNYNEKIKLYIQNLKNSWGK